VSEQSTEGRAASGDAARGPAVRVSDHGAVRRLTLCRPDAYNTITPQLRDELAAALDGALTDRGVRVILLDAEGPAFCAGYGLDWATAEQARAGTAGVTNTGVANASSSDSDKPGATAAHASSDIVRPVPSESQPSGSHRGAPYDVIADLRMIAGFADTWAKLHDSTKPTVAAVQGWCIAGGANLAFHAHLIVAAESARFGYPPSRVWGVPEAPWSWVARMGLQQARRFMLTGDEFSARQALDMGVVLEVVPDDELADAAMALAQRIALVPAGQLEMITLALNSVAGRQYDPDSSRLLGTVFDGAARHSADGAEFVQRSMQVGFREAVRERDRPFGDYGERPQNPGAS